MDKRASTCKRLLAFLPIAMLWLLATILLLQNGFIAGQLRDIRLWQATVERHREGSSGVKMAPLEVTKFVTMTVTRTSSTDSFPTNHPQSSGDSASTSSSSSPPTIILSTSENERRSDSHSTSLSKTQGFSLDLSSLVPSIYVPIKWRPQIQVEDVKKYLASGWTRLKRAAVVILHWPLPVAEESIVT